MTTFMRLGGPGAEKPKAPVAYGWQSPGFQGLGAAALQRLLGQGAWIGMRCDNYVVIDCDDDAAMAWWNAHTKFEAGTWERKTPHGYHFIYRTTPGSPETSLIRPIDGVNLDVLAGTGRQIVLWADGYEPITGQSGIVDFRPSWLPPEAFRQADHSDGRICASPFIWLPPKRR